MPKKIFTLFFILFFLKTNFVAAQSFGKGTKVLETGIGFASYQVATEDPYTNVKKTDRAASAVIPLVFEYGIRNKIGLSAELGFESFFTKRDTLTNNIASASSATFVLCGNFHYVRSARTDIYSGLGFGFSNFQYHSNNFANSRFESSGGAFVLKLIDARLYLSNHIGIKLQLDYASHNYLNGIISDDFGDSQTFRVKLTGTSFGVGLAVKW